MRDLTGALKAIRVLIDAASESDDIEVIQKRIQMVRIVLDKTLPRQNGPKAVGTQKVEEEVSRKMNII